MSMRRCLVWIAAILLWGSTSARGQQVASLSGYVKDAASEETLLQAHVTLQGTPRGTATNNAGFYTLTGLEPGQYTVVASYIGYREAEIDVTLEPGEEQWLDIELRPDGMFIDELTVTAKREVQEEVKDLGMAEFSAETVEQLPTILEPDVFRALQLLPGVKAASDYSSGLYIRGGDPGQTLILLDGTTVYNPTHVFGFFSTFNPDAIKDVRLYKGGFPAEYGGRLGAVVDIYNKDGNRRELGGSFSAGLLASRFFLEGPHGNGSWMIALRRSTLEPLLAYFDDREGIPEGFYFYDVNAKVNLDASDRDRFSLSLYTGTDVLDLTVLEDARLDMDYGNRTISANWNRAFSEHLFSTFTLTTSRYFSKPRLSLGGTEFSQSSRIYDTSIKADFEYTPSERHQVKTGLWTGYFHFPFESALDGEVTFDPEIRTGYASVYVQETYRPSWRWRLQGGVRLTYFGDGAYVRASPRLSMEYRPLALTRVQASYGRYHQFQTLITNESFSGFDFWLTAAEGVPPAYGDQFILGLKTYLGEAVSLDSEVYYRTMQDLFELDPYLPDPAGLDYADYFQFGEGYAYGAEVQMEKPDGRLNGFVAYTFGVTRRRFPQVNVVDGRARDYPPKFDRRHEVDVLANYRLGGNWWLTSVFTYATGQAYTDPEGQYKLLDATPLSGQRTLDVLVSNRLNEDRLPPYHRLDLGLAKLGKLWGFADYQLQLQVINIYKRRNIWFYFHQFDGDDEIKRIEVPQIPIPLPNVSFTLEF